MKLRHFQKVILIIVAQLQVMRSCVIEITGSRRPHKVDNVNPLF